MTTELEHFRVKLAAEVELGADDNLVEGTEVTVEAPTPVLALLRALEAAKMAFLMQMEINEDEMKALLSLELGDAMGAIGKLMGIETGQPKQEATKNASDPPAAVPACINCEHRLDHHDGGGPCLIEDCPCVEYRLSRTSDE